MYAKATPNDTLHRETCLKCFWVLVFFFNIRNVVIDFMQQVKTAKFLVTWNIFTEYIFTTLSRIYTPPSVIFLFSRYVIINMLFVLVFYNFQTQVDIGFKKIMWECLMKIQIQWKYSLYMFSFGNYRVRLLKVSYAGNLHLLHNNIIYRAFGSFRITSFSTSNFVIVLQKGKFVRTRKILKQRCLTKDPYFLKSK